MLSLREKFQDFALQRRVLFDTDPGRLEDGQVVFSPITKALERFYVPDNKQPGSLPLPNGKTYVIYAPPNRGRL